MIRPLRFSCRGFTLVEALVAATLVATAAVALAHLVALGATQSASNRYSLEALVSAQTKLEQLRSATFSHAAASADLNASPAGALHTSTPGFNDVVDDITRRWTIRRLDAGDPNTLVLDVCAFRATDRRRPKEACVSTIRTRRP
jgi:Tfp pilus assembly protein PilV